MGDQQYNDQYGGPQNQAQAQYVQSYEQPPPPPPQQEQVVYQELQTPREQQQHQQPQYRIVQVQQQAPQHHPPPQQQQQQQQQYYHQQPQQQQHVVVQHHAPQQQMYPQQQQRPQYQQYHQQQHPHQQGQPQQQQQYVMMPNQNVPQPARVVPYPPRPQQPQQFQVQGAGGGGGQKIYLIQQGQHPRPNHPGGGGGQRVLYLQQQHQPPQQQQGQPMRVIQQHHIRHPRPVGPSQSLLTQRQPHPAGPQAMRPRGVRVILPPGHQGHVRIVNPATGTFETKPRASLVPCPPPANIRLRAAAPPPPNHHPGGGGAPGSNEIAYNVEHVFKENGKTVRKMPIKMGDETLWVDCVDKNVEVNAAGGDHVMLDLDLGTTVHSGQQQQQQPQHMGLTSGGKKGAKDFSVQEKRKIVAECTEDLISPAQLATKYNVNVSAIRNWVKQEGKPLPAKYKVTSTSTSSSKPPAATAPPSANPAQSNQSLLLNAQNSEETITLYSAPGGAANERSHSPPAQVVRQLVVTDNKGVANNQPANQLTMPQRPAPPGGQPNKPGGVLSLPKPVPAQEQHKPKIVPGKVALCKNCGAYSVDQARCDACKKTIPEGCKIMPDPDYKPPPDEKAKAAAELLAKRQHEAGLRNVRITPKRPRKSGPEEPECIALSSDEEDAGEEGEAGEKNPEGGDDEAGDGEKVEEHVGAEAVATEVQHDVLHDAGFKESPFKPGPGSANDTKIASMVKDLQGMINQEITGEFASMVCRSIRVGSYKSLIKERVFFTQKGIFIKMPYLTDNKRIVTLVISAQDILKIQMLPGRNMPLLFVSVTPTTCERIRKDLNMSEVTKKGGLFFDLSSEDETMKRITMLPEKMMDDVKQSLMSFFGNNIDELDSKTANELLVKSTPKTSTQQQMLFTNQLSKKDGGSGGNGNAANQVTKIDKYCQFPATGASTVSVTQEDYYCLEDESFLNDVIIDFYFKWIQHSIIPDESRDKTHIFTTFFYKRLTTRPQKQKNKLHPIEDNVNLSAAEKRYERVRRWTKKVNIFEKDFVIVPINEHSHWFVAVICFPGMIGMHKMDTGEEVKPEDVQTVKPEEKRRLRSRTKKVMQIGSTSIIPLKSGLGSAFSLDDESDRDEADAEDDDMVVDDDENTVLIKTPAKSPEPGEGEDKKSEEADDPLKVEDKKDESDEKYAKSKFCEDSPDGKKAEAAEEGDENASDGAKEIEKFIKEEEEFEDSKQSDDKDQKDSPTKTEVESEKADSKPASPKDSTEEAEAVEKKEDEESKPDSSSDGSEVKPDVKDDDNASKESKDSKPSSPKEEEADQDKTKTKGETEDDVKKESEEEKSPKNKDDDEESSEAQETLNIKEAIRIKQPCILIFDSLQTASRARVAATLREYLKCEYKTKMNKERDFNKDNMKGCCPKVPQQPNFSDCGLFALQYVESFFKDPLQDYNLPIKSLQKWFAPTVMRHKRADIAKIIRELTVKQHKEKKITFPNLTFTQESGSGYTDDEDEDGAPLAANNKAKLLMKAATSAAASNGAGSSSTSGATRVICLTSGSGNSKATSVLTPTKVSSPAGSSNQALMIQRKKGKVEFFTLDQKSPTTTGAASAATTTSTTATASPSPPPTTSSSSVPVSDASKVTKKVSVLIPKLTGNLAGLSKAAVRKEITIPAVSSTTSSSEAEASTSETSKEAAADGSVSEKDDSKQSPDSTSNNTQNANSKDEAAAVDGGALVSYSDSSSNHTPESSSKIDEQDQAEPELDLDVDMEVDEDGAPILNNSVATASAAKRPLNNGDLAASGDAEEEEILPDAKKAKKDPVVDEPNESSSTEAKS